MVPALLSILLIAQPALAARHPPPVPQPYETSQWEDSEGDDTLPDSAVPEPAPAFVFTLPPPPEPLPELPFTLLPVHQSVPAEIGTVSRRPVDPRIPLGIGAAVALVASGTLYGLAERSRLDTEIAGDSVQNLQSLKSRSHAELAGSIGTGMIAVAGGVGAVVIGEW